MPRRSSSTQDALWQSRHLASRYRAGEVLIRYDASTMGSVHVVELYDGERWREVAVCMDVDAANAVRRLVRG